MKINLITLGCPKNVVDSEHLLAQFERNNISIDFDNDNSDAKIVIINTCGFIHDAKEQSIQTILQFVQAKQNGEIEKLFVIGCLSQRYKEYLQKDIPEVDEYFGVKNLNGILKSLQMEYFAEAENERFLTTPSHYAYLKIAEGCNRLCAFCAIPQIRGEYISTPIETLVVESQRLARKGVKELILVAQDLSFYGFDLYKKFALVDLVSQLSEIEGIEWIRLHYAYPHPFPAEIIELMKNNRKICRYLDIPFQHISDSMLKKMRRGYTKEQTFQLIESLRREIPEITLRTTLLVGYPDETKEDFEELKSFVTEMRFERLGVFVYSHEEDTFSHQNFADNIPSRTKKNRYDSIMKLQQKISLELNKEKIGKTLKCLVDGKDEKYFIARSEFDSPDVDQQIFICAEKNEIEIGKFYNVEITAAQEYDLFGKIV